jgi:excisionase family DNA binding protein
MTFLARALIEAIEEDPSALDALAAALAPRLADRLMQPSEHDDAWLGSKQAADYLGITLDALHKLTAARRIPFEQEAAGCKCWFRRFELDAWRRGTHDTIGGPNRRRALR